MASLPRDPLDQTVVGDAFEDLCAWYLENSPEYRLKDVTRAPGHDIGIDLVASDTEGGRWAIQCKGYDPSNTVAKRDIDSFLSASATPEYSYRLLIASTNHIAANALKTLRTQEKQVGQLLLSDLRRSQVNWQAFSDETVPARPQPKTPKPYQQAAGACPEDEEFI